MAVRDGDGDSVRKQLEKGFDVNQELKVNMLMHVCTYMSFLRWDSNPQHVTYICIQMGIVNRNIIFFRREPWLYTDGF